MAKLEINVRGLEALSKATGGFGGGEALTRQLRTQGRLAERMAKTFQDTLKRIDEGIGGIAQRLDRQFTSVIPKGMDRQFNRTIQNIQVNVTKVTKTTNQQFNSVTNNFQRGMDRALDNVARKGRSTAAKLGLAFGAAGRGLGRLGGGFGRGLGGAGGILGSAIGSFGGGGGLGGLVRGVGGAAGGVLSGVGGLGGAALSGAGGLFSAGATTIGGAFGPIGGAIGSGLGGIGSSITGVLSGALQGAASIGGGVLQAAANVGGAIADKITTTLKIGLVAGVALALTSVVKAAEFERIEEPFRNIARSVGVDATDALERFREVTKGTVSDLDLMTQFNRAVQLGAVTSAEDFETLAEASRRLGKAVGRDAKDALEDLSLGIGRQSKLILDNLGIIVSAEGAYQRYAAELGKTASALSDTEKRTAFVAAAMRAVETALAKAGPEVETFSDKWSRLKGTFENLLVSVGRPLLAALESIVPQVTAIAQGLAAWLNDNRVGLAEKLKESVSGIAETLANIASTIKTSSPSEFFANMRSAAETVANYLASIFEEAGVRIESALVTATARAAEAMKGELKAGLAGAAEGLIDNPASGIGAVISTLELVTGRDITSDIRSSTGTDTKALRAEAAKSADVAAARAKSPFDERLASIRNARAALPDPFAFIGAGASAGQGTKAGSPVAVEVINSFPATGRAPSGIDPSFFEPGRLQGIRSAASSGSALPASIPGATDAESILRSGLESLATLGIEMNKLVPEVQDQLFKALESEETVGRLRERAAEHLARSYDRAVDAELKLTNDKLKDVEKQKRAQDKALEAFEKGMSDLTRSYEDTIAGIRQALEETQARIREQQQQALANIENQVQSRIGQLAGIGGGLDPQGGLPLNVFKAIEKVRRGREKERFNQLRDLTSGLSSSDLAANDGFLLQQILREQAEKEIGSAALIAETSARASEELRAAAAEAAEAERIAGEEFVAAATELRTELGEVSKETVQALTEVAAQLLAVKADLEAQKKAMQRLRGLIR